jgi:methionyl-tRNA formyltransferase
MDKDKGLLIFAGKQVGLELVQFLLKQSYPVRKIIVATSLDIELYNLAIKSNIQADFYTNEIQQQLIDGQDKYDWILSLWSPYILKDDVLKLANYRLNIHPSYLPNGGGNDNAMWTIRNETKGGVSLIEIEKGIDEGAIYDQVEVKFNFPITGNELNNLLRNESITLFKKSWPEIYQGNKLPVKKKLQSYYTRAQTNQDRVKSAEEKMMIKDFILWALAHDFSPNTTAEVIINDVHYKIQINIKRVL